MGQQLDLHGIITETEKRGMSFNQLLTIPEKDEWEYSDGKSTTCVAFILAMYKAAGMFAPFTESIQVTEFTVSASIRNHYSLCPVLVVAETDILPLYQRCFSLLKRLIL